jgi:hypothetical protein
MSIKKSIHIEKTFLDMIYNMVEKEEIYLEDFSLIVSFGNEQFTITNSETNQYLDEVIEREYKYKRILFNTKANSSLEGLQFPFALNIIEEDQWVLDLDYKHLCYLQNAKALALILAYKNYPEIKKFLEKKLKPAI